MDSSSKDSKDSGVSNISVLQSNDNTSVHESSVKSDSGDRLMNKNTVLNYINYYILESDIERYFNPYSYRLIFWVEIVAIFASLAVFYLQVILQIFSYYFLGPSLTLEDEAVMTQERILLNEYIDVKSKYELMCTGTNLLGIRNKDTNAVIEAHTLTGNTISNCSSLILP